MRNIAITAITLLCVLQVSATAGGNSGVDSSQCRLFEAVTKRIKSKLPSKSSHPAVLIAFGEDSRYGLNLEGLWEIQQECMRREGHGDLSIHARHLPAPVPLRAYLQSKEANLPDSKWRLEGLNLAGDLLVDRIPNLRIGLRVQILDSKARILAIDTIPDISPLSVRPDISQLYSRVMDPKFRDADEFHQQAVAAIEANLYSGKSKAKFLPGETFSFRDFQSQIEASQFSALKKLLPAHFGFSIDSNANSQMIRLEPYGGLVFHRQGILQAVDSFLTQKPLMDARMWMPESAYTVVDTLAKNDKGRPLTKPMVFSQGSDRFPRLGSIIQREIDTVLPGAYGGLSGSLDTAYLRRVFKGGEKSIQIGYLANGKDKPKDPDLLLDGKGYSEKVNYYRVSSQEYVDTLIKRSYRGDRFDVKLSLLRIYQEGENGNRFWALVYQEWRTRDRSGKVKYQDDGILLIDFDFEPEAKGRYRLKDFRIYYRFFFFRYRTPVSFAGVDGKRLEIHPFRRIMMDIDASFFLSSPIPPGVQFGVINAGRFEAKPSARTLVGVNTGVLMVIRDDIEKVFPKP